MWYFQEISLKGRGRVLLLSSLLPTDWKVTGGAPATISNYEYKGHALGMEMPGVQAPENFVGLL